jgi:peptidoglycan/LPS O-acetylase OafA/YrhL
MAASPPPPPRFENLNLLRAFAALVVIVYHVIEKAQWGDFPSSGPLRTFRVGWFGVDLFFAISGFVITYSALLLRRSDPEGFIRAYWARRFTRIVPLYVVTLLAWIVMFQPGFFAQGWREWAFQLGTHLTFTHSFWPETHGALDSPNWSLALEMHFYLAVALLIGWIDRTPRWRILAWCLLVSWAYRATIFLLYADHDGWILFVNTTQLPGMLDEFAVGIIAAKWAAERPRLSLRAGVYWTCIACLTGWVAWSLFWPRAGYWHVWWMVVFWRTLLAISFGCVLMAAVHLPPALARWLRPVDFLGEVSYGLYLWHFFAILTAITLFGRDGMKVLLFVLPATIAAASLSWFAFEKPLMRLGRRGRPLSREAGPGRVPA